MPTRTTTSSSKTASEKKSASKPAAKTAKEKAKPAKKAASAKAKPAASKSSAAKKPKADAKPKTAAKTSSAKKTATEKKIAPASKSKSKPETKTKTKTEPKVTAKPTPKTAEPKIVAPKAAETKPAPAKKEPETKTPESISSRKSISLIEPKVRKPRVTEEKPAAPAPAAAPVKKEAEPEKPEPSPARKSLSLIEPKEKKVRVKDEKFADKKTTRNYLPTISRILNPQAAPKPEKAAEPAASEPADSGEVSDDKIIHIKPPIIVKELAQMMNVRPFQVIGDLMEMNIFANINQSIEPDIAADICTKHGFVFEREKRQKGEGVHKPVEHVEEPLPPPPIEKQKKTDVKPRAPIVTFMGHVDHGKTSLMDVIRKTRVVAGEAGGITQHIGAYSVEYNSNQITFLDTPGHAAFTAMRARGANVTDIVVLVVAADDGLMPQTLEAISHAKAANVQIIVAINKIDLASANIDKVKGQLQEKGLTPEDWGGEIICCPVSAIKQTGIDHLLDMLLLQAEVMELKANPHVDARGTVIEAQVEQGRGPTATIIIGMGTLKIGDPFICGNYSGKVKSLVDDRGKSIKEAGPATPVKVLGFAGLPNAGDELVVMESERATKLLSEERLMEKRQVKLAKPQRVRLENLFASISADQKKSLNVVLKSDVQGSLEALISSLAQIKSDKIDLEIIHGAVGPVTESDVLLSTASNAIVVGFNVKVENGAAAAAKREDIQIKLYSIIYELIDQMKEAMAGLLDPETRENPIGHAEIRKVFDLTKGMIAGCMVTDGRIARNARARVLRGKQPIYDGGISTLKRFQDDAKEVRSGLECGIKLGDFTEYEVGDTIECYTLEKVAQKL